MTFLNAIKTGIFIFMLIGGVEVTQVNASSYASPNAAPQRHHKAALRQSRVAVLPRTHQRVVHRGTPYYVWGGRFYRQSAGMYVSITAPIGAIVPSLPGGFITIGTGPRRHYYYGGAYYRPAKTGYVVVEEPSEAPALLPVADAEDRIIVYPAAQQTEEQRGRDRYECHLWASKETDFDPTLANTNPHLKNDYRRAINACLEARDYVVK